MNKKELRKLYLHKRRQLPDKEIMRLDDLLLIRFQQYALGDVETVLSYMPLPAKQEIDLQVMTRYLAFLVPSLRVAYPVMNVSSNNLKPVEVTEETVFIENEYGITEPLNGLDISVNEIDLVFVPLLAYDKQGYRVGYGKGFYDRFLSLCRDEVIKVGFSYFEPEGAIDDINEFDVPLNLCITPFNTYEF